MKIKFLDGSEKNFASLVGRNLRDANLRDADLSGADLSGADLSGADLSDANLSGANLSYADLSGADLSGANLSYANLRGANLRYADLSGANLRGADLSYADLSGANLSGAKLPESDVAKIVSTRTIVGAGTLRVFKKLANGTIAELEIPADAARVGGVTGRKCRAEYAKVISGEGKSGYDSSFFYASGQIVRPDKWDNNPLIECAPGIHFFITRGEAEAY